MDLISTTRPQRSELSSKGKANSTILDIPPTDGELLMRYRSHGDEEAFGELVDKHGPLVWTLCWQILRNHHDREDAFQATFLILAKRAASIRSCDSLAGWLYRVAYRTALRARLSARNKPTIELANDLPAEGSEQLASIQQHEQRSILLEELHALPERYQMPLILCYLQGKTRRIAADEIGCTLEAVKGRLARGRQLLRQRLIRRGVSLSVAMAAMSLPVKAALAAVTPELVGGTIAGCRAWSSGSGQISTVSQQALHLAQQGTTLMTLASFTKPVLLAVALLAVATVSVAVDSSNREGAAGKPSSTAVILQDVSAGGDEPQSVERDVAVDAVAAEDSSKLEPIEATTPLQGPDRPAGRRGRLTSKLARPESDIVKTRVDSLPDAAELQLKLGELQENVLELQLRAKELEIDALGHEGEEREKLMEESRKFLLRAEKETLKAKLEQQRASLEQLKLRRENNEQVHKFSNPFGQEERAKLMRALAKAEEALALSRASESSRQEAIQKQLIELQSQMPQLQKQLAAAQSQYSSSTITPPLQPSIPYTSAPSAERVSQQLQAGDRIKIQVLGALPEWPIDGEYTIESMGTVPLGAKYGRVKVIGQSVLEAEETIRDQLSKILTDPVVQVVSVGRQSEMGQPTPAINPVYQGPVR